MLTNMLHYRTNYMIISAIIALLVVVTNPHLIFTAFACFGVQMFFNHGLKGPIKIGDTQLTAAQTAYTCVAINLALFWFSGALFHTLTIVIYSVGVCGLHMLFRPRSITATSSKMYDEFKLAGFASSWMGGDSGKSESEEPLLSTDMEGGANKDADGNLRQRGK
jgi:hypothetical protein